MKPVVLIPTYNEAENIRDLITAVLDADKRVEILVVDDDSPDGTALLVNEFARHRPRVHLLWRKEDRGRGTAGIAGFIKSLELGADCILEMDGDFSHPPRYIPTFLEAICRADVVIGSRMVSGGQEMGRGFVRRWITRFANQYIRWILRIPIQDCTSGFRCFRRTVLETISLSTLTSRGPALVEEILYRCHLQGFSFLEIPILFENRIRGRSTLNLAKLTQTFLKILEFRIASQKNPDPGSGQMLVRSRKTAVPNQKDP